MRRLLACTFTVLLVVPTLALPLQRSYASQYAPTDCEKRQQAEPCCQTKWATNEATGELEQVVPLEATEPAEWTSPTTYPSYWIETAGVAVAPISFATSIRLDLNREAVFQVMEVLPDSPAAAAGLKAGDIVTHINGRAPVSPALLRNALLNTNLDDTVTLSVIWQGETVDMLISPLAQTPLSVSIPWTVVLEDQQGKVEAHFHDRHVDVFLNGQHVPSEQLRTETDHVALLTASGKSLVDIPTPQVLEDTWLPFEQAMQLPNPGTHRGALLLQDGLGFFTDGITHRLRTTDPLLPDLHVVRDADVFTILDDMDTVRYQILFQKGSFFWWRNPGQF